MILVLDKHHLASSCVMLLSHVQTECSLIQKVIEHREWRISAENAKHRGARFFTVIRLQESGLLSSYRLKPSRNKIAITPLHLHDTWYL